MDNTTYADDASARLIQAAEDLARTHMSGYDASHDFVHVERVRRLALHIAHTENSVTTPSRHYDIEIVELAALLHDVWDHKYIRERDSDGGGLQAWLTANSAPGAITEALLSIIPTVSYSYCVRNPDAEAAALAAYPELGAVQDADRLDALGAVGFARVFAYGGANGNRDGGRDGSLAAGMGHCVDKLLTLESLMKTDTGRALAKERTRRVRLMVEWMGEELHFTNEES